MNAANMIAIEAACIAGHLGDWRYGAPAETALQRGLQLAASRYAPFPDAPCHSSQAALFREAVTQVLAIVGRDAGAVGDDRRRGVMVAFNMIDGGVDLAARLSALLAPESQPIGRYRRDRGSGGFVSVGGARIAVAIEDARL